MNAVSPVMPGSLPIEVSLGKDQPEYVTLPAVHLDTKTQPIITRWRPNDKEREQLANGADIVLTQLTFRHPFQPVNLQVCMPDEAPELMDIE